MDEEEAYWTTAMDALGEVFKIIGLLVDENTAESRAEATKRLEYMERLGGKIEKVCREARNILAEKAQDDTEAFEREIRASLNTIPITAIDDMR